MANGCPIINDNHTMKLPHGFFMYDVMIASGTCVNMAKNAHGLHMRSGTLTMYYKDVNKD